jgi:hypothetical protein
MTKEEIIRGFKALSQEEKGAVVQEIAREYCGEQGRSFAEMMSLCCGMMGGMSSFPFATSERVGERA